MVSEEKRLEFERAAGLCGDLKESKRLAKELNITIDYIRKYNSAIFRYCCANGYLDVAKWMKEEFNLTKEDATAHNNYILLNTLEKGWDNIAAWLIQSFELKEDDLMWEAWGVTSSLKTHYAWSAFISKYPTVLK